MAQEALLKDIGRRMDGALEALRKELSGLRTGRASASLLEPVKVEAYGNAVPLNQVATISVTMSGDSLAISPITRGRTLLRCKSAISPRR